MLLKSWIITVKKICGYFWTELFKDSWLIQAISKFMYYCIGNSVLADINRIKEQESFNFKFQNSPRFPVRLLVYAEVQKNANIINILKGQSTSILNDQSYIYTFTDNYKAPVIITSGVQTPYSIELKLNIDFSLSQNRRNISFKKPLQQYGFKTIDIVQNGQIKKCFQLWGIYTNTKCLRDTLPFLLQIPLQWVYKYPGALSVGWKMKQLGFSKKDCLQFLDLLLIKEASFTDITDPSIQMDYTQEEKTFLNLFKHNLLVLKLNTSINNDIKIAIQFLQKCLPAGTILYVFTDNYKVPCNIRSSLNEIQSVMLFKQDFDSVNP